MDTQEISPPDKPSLRQQKYLHFRLMPGDESLIEQLTMDQQKILKSEGSYSKRAEDLGVAVGTVRSRLHRAREALLKLRIERDRNDMRSNSDPH
jgi:hypothetical protein